MDAAALLPWMGLSPTSEALGGALSKPHVAWQDPGCPGTYRLGQAGVPMLGASHEGGEGPPPIADGSGP